MRAHKPRKPRPPLDENSLNELALTYVGRFATTRAKLQSYLVRKVRERGWEGSVPADAAAIAARFAASGYVDDAAFAMSKSRALTGRGYGLRRVELSLRAAGVEEEDSAAAREHAEAEGAEAALRFARRRRIGPFASEAPDPRAREKALAAMVRAGHGFALSRRIVELRPGTAIDAEELAGRPA